jgi:hypothetical protein
LLSAAFLGTIAGSELTAFTGYSGPFVSAIARNMLNNRLWINGRYDHSSWLLKNGTIAAEELWEHIETACGMLWMPEADTAIFGDPIDLYLDERGGLTY